MLKEQLGPIAADSTTRKVVEAWRRLSGGSQRRDEDRRSLVACSGGADSVALALILASKALPIVLGHIVHDFREESHTLAERDLVAGLASRLGVGFCWRAVTVQKTPGNDEANARKARYAQLEDMALQEGCPFVLSAHHANDQLETMLMAMLRGSGLAGMGGIAPQRPLGTRGIKLIRPMLATAHADCARLCALAEQPFATDPTNADESRLRAALRHGPAASLSTMRPAGLAKIAETAAQLRQAQDLVDTLAGELLKQAQRTPKSVIWERPTLAHAHRVIAGAALRLAFVSLHNGTRADRLTGRAVASVLDAIGRNNRQTRRFEWTGVQIVVGSDTVFLQRTQP